MSTYASAEVSRDSGRVTLFISHVSDGRSLKVREYLASLAQLGLTRSSYWLTVESAVPPILGDFEVDVIDESGLRRVRLFEVLSAAGGINAVDVVGLVVDRINENDEHSLSQSIPTVRKAFERWLRDAPINDIRISGRSYDAELPGKSFFSASSNVRVAILPLDPSHDYSVYRPFDGADSEKVIGHVAVEVVSLLGCWRVQQEVPIDSLRASGRGADGNGIHMVLSVVRSIAVPSPPVSEALGSNSQLPAPAGFTSVPKPERLAYGLADKIYPKELIFQASPEPEGPSEFTSIDRFLLRFLRQFVMAIATLPRVIRMGIQHEMDDLAITAMEDAVGGAASSVGLTSSRLQRRATEPVDFDLLIEDLIARATTEIDQNYRFSLPSATWQTMSHKLLALADGAGDPGSRLLTDDAVIVEVDVLVPPCEASTPSSELVRIILEPVDEQSNISVVEHVGRIFLREISSATNAVSASLRNLRSIPEAIKSRPEIKGDEIIRVAAIVGAALILISLGAFSPLRPIFAFEWLPFSIRDAMWAFPAALGTLLSVWVLVHVATKSDRPRRIVDVVSSLLIPLLLLSMLVRFTDIRQWMLRNGGGANYRYAVAIFAVCLVLAVSAIRFALKSSKPKHRSFGRAGVIVGSVYLVISALIGLAQDERPLLDGLPDVRSTVFVVLFPSALISFGISVSRIAVARVREIYKALLVGRLIEWGVGELRAGRDAETRLEVLRVHWAALGAMITRLVRYPLGRNLASALEREDVATGKSDPLKLDFARLDLTNRGRGGLEARLKQSVVRQGWLNQQFAVVCRSYGKSAGFDRGLADLELTNVDPLACTATPTAEEASKGSAKGDRWAFVRDLFDGNFEEILRLPADQIRFDALYESVLIDPKSIQLVGAEHHANNVASFLGQAVSLGGLTVPVGFLKLLVTGGDRRLAMKRMVWWPSSLVELPTQLSTNSELVEDELRESELVKPWEEFGTRFAMSVQVSWSEPFGYDDFAAASSQLQTSAAEATQPHRER